MSRTPRLLGLAACGWLVMLGAAQAQREPEEALARDLTIGQRPVYQFVQQQAVIQQQRPPQERVNVEAWTDRVDATYRVGEPVTISIRPQREAHITVLNIGTSGRTTVLFPNHMQRDSRVRAGQVLTLGGPGAPYNIVPQGPAGVELVQVVATTRPLSLPELNQLSAQTGASPFLSLGRMGEEVTRDLAIQFGSVQPAVAGPSGMANLMIRVLPQQTLAAPAAPATTQSAQLLALLQQLGIPVVTQMVAPAPPPPAPATLPAIALPAGFSTPQLLIRTDRTVYRETDPVQITVAALAECRLTLLNIGPTGNVAQLFPNPAQTDTLLRAGQVVMIPPPGSSVAIRPRGPSGMETIVGLCAQEGGAAAPAALTLTAQRDLAAVASAVIAPAAAATPAAGAGSPPGAPTGTPTVAAAATVYFVQP